mmetsp:Transcript_90638/g.281871  ORF Transcript_90638/g.281871 Transcript_90638/m.281871 type:complete len:216 (-) Transcript_90638:27-674(-)
MGWAKRASSCRRAAAMPAEAAASSPPADLGEEGAAEALRPVKRGVGAAEVTALLGQPPGAWASRRKPEGGPPQRLLAGTAAHGAWAWRPESTGPRCRPRTMAACGAGSSSAADSSAAEACDEGAGCSGSPGQELEAVAAVAAVPHASATAAASALDSAAASGSLPWLPAPVPRRTVRRSSRIWMRRSASARRLTSTMPGRLRRPAPAVRAATCAA